MLSTEVPAITIGGKILEAPAVAFGRKINSKHDPLETFVRNGPTWIHKLRHSPVEIGLVEGFSYRDFMVRMLLHTVMPNGDQYTFATQNLKLVEGVEKRCAEMFGLDLAFDEGASHCVGLIIAATTNRRKIKEVTNFDTSTLHSCSPCQDDYIAEYIAKRFISGDTPIITTGLAQKDEDPTDPMLDRLEYHAASEMLARHKHPAAGSSEFWPQGIIDTRFQRWIGRIASYPELVETMAPSDAARKVIVGNLPIAA